jgi:hypothetical protein
MSKLSLVDGTETYINLRRTLDLDVLAETALD